MTYQDFRIVRCALRSARSTATSTSWTTPSTSCRRCSTGDEPWDFTPGHPERGRDDVIERYRLEHRPRRPVDVRAYRHVRAPRRGAQLHCRVPGGCATGSLRWRTTPRLWILSQLRDRHAVGLVMANEGTARPPLSPVELARSCQPQPGLRRERHSGAWQFRPAVPQQAMPVAGRQGGRS